MSYTQRSLAWKIGQSWYFLLFLPLGMTSFLVFLYMGARAKRFKWFAWAAVYLAATFYLLSRSAPRADGTDTLPEWAGFTFVAMWLMSLIHAIRARGEYLEALDALQGGGPGGTGTDPYAVLREEAAEDYGLEHVPAPASPPVFAHAAPPPPPAFAAPRPPPAYAAQTYGAAGGLDLNRATEAEVAALPMIGPVLARQIVQKRDARGGFWSVEDFGQEMGIRPDVLDRLRPLVAVGGVAPSAPEYAAPPPPPPPPAPPAYAAPPPPPAPAAPPPPSAPTGAGGAPPPPPPFSGPRPFEGSRPFGDDDDDDRPTPPPPPPPAPPRGPGRRQVDY